MLAALSWFLLVPFAGLAVGAVAALVIPPISKSRNARRAQEAGALWVGLANISGTDDGQPDAVRRAMSDVGALYGESLSAVARRAGRPVGGLLWVFADHVEWEPRIWLGRGSASPWRLDCGEIRGFEVAKLPAPAIRSYEATLTTADGVVRMQCVDPGGLEQAVSAITR